MENYLKFKHYPYKIPIGIENEIKNNSRIYDDQPVTITNDRFIKVDPEIIEEALKNAIIKPITDLTEVMELSSLLNLDNGVMKHVNEILNKSITVEKLILSIRYAYTKINIYNDDEKVLEFRITNNNDDTFKFSKCVPNFILVSIVKGIRIIQDSEIIIYI